MEWKLDDSRPIWPQLKTHIMRAIVAGQYEPGGDFPTVRDLSADAGVNRNTMQRALSELENDGLLITNRTSGRTVTEDGELISGTKAKIAADIINEFLGEMESIGYSPEDIVKMIQEKGDK